MDDLLKQLNRWTIEISPETVVQQVFENIFQTHPIRKPMIQNRVWINFPESFSEMNRLANHSNKHLLAQLANCGVIDSKGRLHFKNQIKLENIYQQLIK